MRITHVVWALAVCCLVLSQAAAEDAADYKAIEKEFLRAWKPDKSTTLGLLAGLRDNKIKTAEALEATSDPRAIAAFGKGHKKQLRFAFHWEAEWTERRESWKKLEESMRRALEGRPVQPNGTMLVSRSEKKWLDEEGQLEELFRHVSEEKDVAQRARTAMSTILGSLKDKKRASGLKAFKSAVGKGESPIERDFVRALGITEGADITEALLDYAQQDSSPLTQAALHALGTQNAPENVDHLLSFMKDERWQVRAAAVGALGYFKEDRVVDALINIAINEKGVLQRHCFVALNRILGKPMPGGVEAWTTWWVTNKAPFIEKWTGHKPAPVRREVPPGMVRQGQGHTSFYGIQTNSKHLVFIIDRSGSMNEPAKGQEQAVKPKTRMDVAKEELKKAIRSLGSDESDERGAASFNIVAYAGDIAVYKSGKMVEATVKAKEKAFDWIDKLDARGPTNIYDAVEAAFQIISARKAKKNANRGADTFFLMTDGQPTTGAVRHPDLIRQEVIKLNLTRQIIIHTIGITSPPSEVDLEREKKQLERMTPQEKKKYEELKAALDVFLEKLAAENRGEYIKR